MREDPTQRGMQPVRISELATWEQMQVCQAEPAEGPSTARPGGAKTCRTESGWGEGEQVQMWLASCVDAGPAGPVCKPRGLDSIPRGVGKV